MNIEAQRVIHATFSNAEVIDALKRRYPEHFHLQCIPLVSKDGGHPPKVEVYPGGLKVSHINVLTGDNKTT